MKLECSFCKTSHGSLITLRLADLMFCSVSCLRSHLIMSETKQRTGLIACFYHGIMVISRCIHRLIKSFRR